MDPQQQQQQYQQQQYQQYQQQQQQLYQQQMAASMQNPYQQQPPPQQPPQLQQQQAPPPPQQYQAPQQQHPAAGAGGDEIRTLWIGDLQYWMDENYIQSCLSHTGEVISAKVIRNKQTAQPEGYGFIEFVSRAAAERTLLSYNGTQMPNSEQNYRLNWATFGAGEKRSDNSADYTIFVGDLASDVNDYTLQETFKGHYVSVKGAKVVTDRTTGRSKGYGFVRFGDESEQVRAMTEMNGMYCSTKPMRIGPAATKNTLGGQQYPNASYPNTQGTQSDSDPTNTTIFVGGLDSNVTDDNLRQVFSQYGELVHVKIPLGKRCGFVQFTDRACAEEALLRLNGTQLGGQSIRLSWGRSPANKQQDASAGAVQPQPDPNQWNGNAYGYNQGYASYGYAPPVQDQNQYAHYPYPGYGNYQPQQ